MGVAASTGLSSCLVEAVGGDITLVALPEKPFYEQLDARPYNLNFPITPAAVTYPKSADQIAQIVKCAATNNVKVQARSGGHSYANYCLSTRGHEYAKFQR